MSVTLKTLSIPIFRRYWLWYGWADRSAILATSTATKSWRQGTTLEEKFQIIGQNAYSKALNKLQTEWNKLESSKEGSIRNRVFRLAQAILSREDPRESYLKEIAYGDIRHAEIIYPHTFQETLVRRRLRHMAADAARHHRKRFMWWILASIPQIPLMVTPLPNVTVYYTGWRLYSHYQAAKGAKLLKHGFTELDTQQLHTLRDELLGLKEQGVVFSQDSWPAKLIRKEKRYLDIFERFKKLQKQQRLEDMNQGLIPDHVGNTNNNISGDVEGEVETMGIKTTAVSNNSNNKKKKKKQVPLALAFTPSPDLSKLTNPEARLTEPLSDEAAVDIGRTFTSPHVFEMIARARRKAGGAMFIQHFPHT